MGFNYMAYEERNNRLDNQGRVLRNNEFQQQDGRYKFRWRDKQGVLKTVYSWRLVDEDVTPEGKKHTQSLREIERSICENGYIAIDLDEKSVTFENRFWLNMQNRNINERTRKNYESMYKLYIKSALGKKSIIKIDNSLMRKVIWQLLDVQGLNPRAIENICNMLRPVFRDAISSGLISTNPIDGIMVDVRKDNRWVKRIYPEQKAIRPYVYRYIDIFTGEIKYIGIVYDGSLSGRIKGHKNDFWANDSKWKIQYFQVDTRSEAEAIESHLIALYKTYRFYNTAKSTWGINSYLPNFDDKWIDYAE